MPNNNQSIIGSTAALEGLLLARLEPLKTEGLVKRIVVHTFYSAENIPDIMERFQNIEPLVVLSTPIRTYRPKPQQSNAMVCRLDNTAQFNVAIVTASRADDGRRRKHLYNWSDKMREILPAIPFEGDDGQPSRYFVGPIMIQDQFFSVEKMDVYIAQFNVETRIAKTGVW